MTRMDVYLPIAEMSVNGLLIIIIGGAVGLLSGLFGVGGGFAMTPILIFLGIPPTIAVSSQANQLIAASIVGTLSHYKQRNIDFKMGLVMLVGSGLGCILGVYIFQILQRLGQIDLTISLFYILFLGFIGILMFYESIKLILKPGSFYPKRQTKRDMLISKLPFKMKFPRSKLYVSCLLPASIGFVGGILVSIMGIGGGFILVPAMIYLIGMPIQVVAGTSLFQIIFSTSIVTFLQAATNQTVDIILALLLLTGSIAGVHFGSQLSSHIKGEQARFLLALLIICVAGGLAVKLILPPDDLFDLRTIIRR